jgi:hypothetical protein
VIGVRDVVVRICADDEAVELLARHAGWAGARLEVEHERGVRDEGAAAAAAWAKHGGRSKHLRVEVVAGVGLVLEGSLAVGAIDVCVAVVGLEFGVAFKYLCPYQYSKHIVSPAQSQREVPVPHEEEKWGYMRW